MQSHWVDIIIFIIMPVRHFSIFLLYFHFLEKNMCFSLTRNDHVIHVFVCLYDERALLKYFFCR